MSLPVPTNIPVPVHNQYNNEGINFRVIVQVNDEVIF